MGRKSTYTDEIADEICERLAAGESLRAICNQLEFPSEAAVRGWAVDNAEFSARYSRARGIGLDTKAEETMEIAADRARDPNCRRIEIDAIKWFASKLRPDKYGDRVTMAGDPAAPLQARVVVEHVNPPGTDKIDKARFRLGPPGGGK